MISTRSRRNLTLLDVLHEKGQPEKLIEVYVEEVTGSGSDGILIGFQGGFVPQIVVENKQGELVCHVWATPESLGNDPTHSIEIQLPLVPLIEDHNVPYPYYPRTSKRKGAEWV